MKTKDIMDMYEELTKDSLETLRKDVKEFWKGIVGESKKYRDKCLEPGSMFIKTVSNSFGA